MLRVLGLALCAALTSAMVCTDNTCSAVRCAAVTAESCLGGTFVQNGGFCGCCDACVKSIAKGDRCLSTLLMGVPATEKCGQGLYCDPRTSRCETLPDITPRAVKTCADKLLEAQNGPMLLGRFTPRCEQDGSYSKFQCRGSYCYCADPADGQQILSYGGHIANASSMDCQCARDQAAYMKTGLIGKLFFCTDNGSYKNHQQNRLAPLSCAERVAQINAANSNGMPLLGQFIPKCETDGTYSARQCQGSVCYCADSKGAKIGQYSANIGETMDCKCARDQDAYMKTGMLGKIFSCTGAGSYQKYACQGSVCFCADSTGNMLAGTQPVSVANIGDLHC